MIRCDSKEEREALAGLVWAVKDVLIYIRHLQNINAKKALKELDTAFDTLAEICGMEIE